VALSVASEVIALSFLLTVYERILNDVIYIELTDPEVLK
jgi:hypothetical protein